MFYGPVLTRSQDDHSISHPGRRGEFRGPRVQVKKYIVFFGRCKILTTLYSPISTSEERLCLEKEDNT